MDMQIILIIVLSLSWLLLIAIIYLIKQTYIVIIRKTGFRHGEIILNERLKLPTYQWIINVLLLLIPVVNLAYIYFWFIGLAIMSVTFDERKWVRKTYKKELPNEYHYKLLLTFQKQDKFDF